MARQDSYYPYRPNYTTEVGMVYNPIDMSQANEMVGRQLDQRTQMYQQNLDAVAAAENEMATQKVRGVDRPGINARLEKFTKNIDDVVKDRYQGDYAMARKDILRNIAKERGEITRATQLYDIEQQYAPVIKQLQAQGKYLGNDAMNQAAYDKDGNFIAAPSYDFREQSDYLKLADPLVEKVSKQVKDMVAQPNNYGYIEQKIAQGQAALTEPELDKLVDEYLPTFKANSTFDIDEKIKSQYGGDARNYLKDIVKSTALSATKSEWHQNWLQKEAIDRAAKEKKNIPTPPLFISTDLVSTGNAKDTYTKNNVNYSSGVPFRVGVPLNDAGKFTPINTQFDPKKQSFDEYKAKLVERDIVKKYPQLQDLYAQANKVNSPDFNIDIKRENGKVVSINPSGENKEGSGMVGGLTFTLGSAFLHGASTYGVDAALGAAGKLALPLTLLTMKGDVSGKTDAEIKRDYKELVTTQYQKALKESSDDYFAKGGGGGDYGIRYFVPDITNKDVTTDLNSFNKISQSVIKPGDFSFVDGDLKGKSSDEINKKYTKDGKDLSFTPTKVGGNSETGVLYKVQQPDGKEATTKWLTSYGLQKKYLNSIIGADDSHELINALNGSALDINDTTGEIKGTFPDMQIRNSNKYKAGTYGGELANPEAPRRILMKDKNTPLTVAEVLRIIPKEEVQPIANWYTAQFGKDINEILNEPAIMDKAVMFTIVNR